MKLPSCFLVVLCLCFAYVLSEVVDAPEEVVSGPEKVVDVPEEVIEGMKEVSVCILHGPGRPESYLDLVLRGYENVSARVIDPSNESVPELPANENIPLAVRVAGLHVAYALGECASGGTPWVLLAEDDMVPCEGALDTVDSALADSTDYSTVFFSKFSRAFAMRREVVGAFAAAVQRNLELKPYDIVLRTGIWLPEGERMLVYPTNLFHHIGALSTVPERNSADFIQKHGGLRADVCGEPLV